jgi:hypothetical protein
MPVAMQTVRLIALTAVAASALTLGFVRLLASAAPPATRVVLENDRVKVTERVIAPGGERTPYIRPADQVIVFLNDTKYERIDAETDEKIVRERAGGEVLWHDAGENAPKLVNVHAQPFRSLVIELK